MQRFHRQLRLAQAARPIALLFALAAGGVPAMRADVVSATPGKYQGVIHFNASTVPTIMTIDARDITNSYTAHATATQGAAGCPAGSQDWCYEIVVESALASSYYLRPIAWFSSNTSGPAPRAPFPPSGPYAIAPKATVTQNLTYTPGIVSGGVTVKDMNNSAITPASLFFSVNDTSNTFPEPCGGSANFCPFNSIFTSPPVNAYQLFLQPDHIYSFLAQSFSINEGSLARSDVGFNSGELLGKVGAGVTVTRDLNLTQQASVTGTATLTQPIYSEAVAISGSTTAGLGFSDVWRTYSSGVGSTSATYTGRIFNFADFSKPFSLQPSFVLSSDGQTSLSYPPVTFTLGQNEQKTINFTGSAATISGRITFDPPYPVIGAAGGVGEMEAAASTATGYGRAGTRLTADAQGGTYILPVFGANWDWWRFGWAFDLGNPNFNSSYWLNSFLNIPVPVTDGSTVRKNFTFDTSLLKVYFTAPPGTTISDPHLDGVTGALAGGSFTPDGQEFAHAEGLNQKAVATGEVRLVLRVHDGKSFRIVPSAAINTGAPATSRTDFSPFFITPNKGDITVVGVPGSLSLTVSSPQEGQVLGCQIPVAGTATGSANISITVNGEPVTTTPAGNSNDPSQVVFSTTVAGAGAQTTITVVASSPTNAPVTAVVHVTSQNSTPVLAAKVATGILWPPQHDLVNVGLAVTSNSACGSAPALTVGVFSNEGDAEETGTGNFSPDAKAIAPATLRLRAERNATGNGRVYLIVATGTSTSGNTGVDCTAVLVPHDYNAESVTAVSAQAQTAVAACRASGAPPSGYVAIGNGPLIGPKQ